MPHPALETLATAIIREGCGLSEEERNRIFAALESYARWWDVEFSREHDHLRLPGQDNFRRYLPFREIRVRHHELRQGQLARIELGRDEMPALLDNALMDAASAALTELGYSYVTVDVRGYRRGSLNEVKFKPQARQAAGS